MYGPMNFSLRVPSGWNVVHHYMVHHLSSWQLMTYTEITEIKWWQILSRLVHSSLVAPLQLQFEVFDVEGHQKDIDSILSNYCHLLGLITALSCALKMMTDSHTIPSHNTVQNNLSRWFIVNL